MSLFLEKFLKNAQGARMLDCGSGRSYSYADILKRSEFFKKNKNAAQISEESDACEDFFAKLLASNSEEISIFTSGTSGTKKEIKHSWKKIFSPVSNSSELRGSVWLCAYEPQSFAGLQVLAQVVEAGGTLLAPSDSNASEEFFERYENIKLCCTPTWIKNFLAFSNREKFSVSHVTLGGEIATQHLLDRLSRQFPNAKISHIYATTETGVCLNVSDGKEGFDASHLDGIFLKKEGDTLRVKLSNGEWFDTKDIIQKRENRIIFMGRDCELGKVGGAKVSLIEVERVLGEIEGIALLRAYFEKSSMAGCIVGLDVKLAKNGDEKHFEKEIREIARKNLDKFHRPRIINFTDAIKCGTSCKILRK